MSIPTQDDVKHTLNHISQVPSLEYHVQNKCCTHFNKPTGCGDIHIFVQIN